MEQDDALQAPDSFISVKKISHALAGALIMAGLVLVARQNYLLFHALAEGFSIVIAGGIFMVAWHSRRLVDDQYLLFLGIAYLFVGGLDYVHLLAYKGMGVFPGHGANLATQIWIATRYLQSLSLLLAPVFIRHRLHPATCFLSFSLISAVLLGAILVWHLFPDCYIEGIGLTRFKIVSEYLISLILLTAMGLLLRNRQTFEKKFLWQMLLAMACSIGSDLSFASYGSVSDFYNLTGHLLKIVSFYLVYQAIIRTGMEKPHHLLFSKLRQNEEKYSYLFKNLSDAAFIIDLKGIFLDANRMATDLLGYHLDKFPNLSLEHITVPELVSGVKDSLSLVQKKGKYFFESIQIASDGHCIPVEISASLIQYNGQPAILGLARDSTARKRIEEHVHLQAQIMANMTEGVLMVRADDFTIAYSNPKFARMFGYDPGELIGRHVTILNATTDKSPAETAAEISGAVCDQGEWHGEVENVKKDGTPFWCYVNIASFDQSPYGKVYIDVHTDITARKEAEKNLQHYAERTAILHHLGQEILGARSPRKIASSALAHLRRMLPEAGVCALLFDLENRRSIPLAMQSGGRSSPIYSDNTLAFQCDTFMNMLLHNQVTLVHQAQHDKPCRIQQAMAADGINFFVAAPLFVGQKLIGALCVFAEEAGPFTQEHIALVEEVATPVAMALQNARLLETVSEHRLQLQGLAARLTEVEEAERQRYAREIHDELGQDITALGINLGILQGAISVGKFTGLQARLEDSQELVEKMTEKVRNVMADLRPPVLDDYGLGAALRWYGDKVSRRLDIPIRVAAGNTVRLAPRLEIALFRVAQEAITNVVKHAQARHVTIQLETTDAVQRLGVIDDGIGFLANTKEPRDAGTGLGMITMRERLAAIGGRLWVESAPGQGTKVIAEVPL